MVPFCCAGERAQRCMCIATITLLSIYTSWESFWRLGGVEVPTVGR